METGDGDNTNSVGMDSDDDLIGEDEVIVETVDALESKLQELVDADAIENSYVEVPQVNLDTVIASTEKVHNIIDQDFERQQLRRDEEIKGNGSLPSEIAKMYPELFKIVDEEFVKFKREAQKEVNYLVKEFEMKKSASAYARTLPLVLVFSIQQNFIITSLVKIFSKR